MHRAAVFGQGQQALYRLVQGAVAAAAHHAVVAAPQLDDGAHGVAPPLGGVDGDLIALAGEYLHHVGEVGFGGLASGGGVIDVEKLFHDRSRSIPARCGHID